MNKSEKLATPFDNSSSIFLLECTTLNGNSWIIDEGEETNKVGKQTFRERKNQEKGMQEKKMETNCKEDQ